MPFSPSSLGDDPISLVIGLVLLIVMLPFLVLFLIAGLELLVLLLVLPFAIAGRIMFGRHWTVEVRRSFTPYWEGQAGSWGQSGTRIREIAAAIERGQLPPNTLAQ